MIKGKAFNLREQIKYQRGAVVSQTLVDEESGTVTLFAFDSGQGLSEHKASFDALVLGLEGEAEVILEGKEIVIREGEMVIMPANHRHALKALRDFKMLLIMIRK